MLEFTAKKEELKKAFGVVSLATEDKSDSIGSHALFKISEGILKLYATDKSKMASAFIAIDELKTDSDTVEFTSDPKKISSLLASSDVETIKFSYDSEKKTLNIFASESQRSFLSFASFSPDEFLSFESELEKTQEIKTLNAGIFLTGIRFVNGFLTQDDKNKKFTKMYISEGVMYGSNGSNRIGAFESPELEGLDLMMFPRNTISPIAMMIERTSISNITIKTTSKIISMFSSDGNYMFGFLKAADQMPKFPINTDEPDSDSFNVDRNLLLKKLNRLAIASGNDLGIKATFGKDNLEMSTLMERSSVENISCNRLKGEEKMSFIVEYKIIKMVLSLFQASNISVYVDKAKCTIRTDAHLEIAAPEGEEPVRKPFKAVALISLARAV